MSIFDLFKKEKKVEKNHKVDKDNLHDMKNELTSEILKTDFKAKQVEQKSVETNEKVERTVTSIILMASGGKK